MDLCPVAAPSRPCSVISPSVKGFSSATGRLGFLAVFSDGSRGIYLAQKSRIASAPNKIPVGAIFLLLDDPNE
jgi:hypothetical protein